MTAYQVGTPVRVATWNLRYDTQPDGIPVAASLAALPDWRTAPPQVLRGEQPWSARRVRVAQRLWASHVDLVGACGNRSVCVAIIISQLMDYPPPF